MSFLAPVYLAAGAALAALVVALHFIVTREPTTEPLPTARFAPERPVSARARALHLSDLLLLLCRVTLILAVGAALAVPVLETARRPVTRIVLVDRSGSVADPAAAGDSARSLLAPGDVGIAFDSTAETGSISAALVTALRAAVARRDETDSLELAIVSAFGAEEIDQATDSIRALWPGAIRLVRVAPRPAPAPAPVPMLVGRADDPLRYALPPESGAADSAVRIVRRAATAADSAWVAQGRRTLVLWPVSTAVGRDTVGAVSAGDVVVVAPFPREKAAVPLPGRVVARWADGSVAAAETVQGSGCIRTVSVPVPAVGDLVLDPRFQRLAAQLTMPCGVTASHPPLDESRLAALAASDRGARVGAGMLGRPSINRSSLAPWLLAAALALGLGELLLRRRRSRDVPLEGRA